MMKLMKKVMAISAVMLMTFSINLYAADTFEVMKTTGTTLYKIFDSIKNSPIKDIEKDEAECVKEVIVSSLNVREDGNTDSKILGQLYWGNEITVVDTKNGWDKINFNGLTGWVYNEYLGAKGSIKEILEKNAKEAQKKEENPYKEAEEEKVIKQVRVTTEVLNIRKQADVNSDVIGTVKYGATVSVYKEVGEWYKIKNNGTEGYIFAEYTQDADKVMSRSGRGRNTTTIAETIVDNALSYVGCRYVYGGKSPSGFDCSGFVEYLYKPYIPNIPRTATPQAGLGIYVSKNDLVEGDLVFFTNYSQGDIQHVGIYIGDGMFVHAANSQRGVVTDTLLSGYYSTNYLFARRVL